MRGVKREDLPASVSFVSNDSERYYDGGMLNFSGDRRVIGSEKRSCIMFRTVVGGTRAFVLSPFRVLMQSDKLPHCPVLFYMCILK